jgi:hypothetical protein
MKTYIISKKKIKERNKKAEVKTSCIFELEDEIFWP